MQLDVRRDVIGECDSGRLARIVSNLVGNAIQHSEGLVHVSVVDEGEHVSLKVQNSGPSISPRILPRLFEPFQRGDTSAEGLGLGLYIVREVVRAHHGTVAVTSTRENETVFTVSIPKRPGQTSSC